MSSGYHSISLLWDHTWFFVWRERFVPSSLEGESSTPAEPRLIICQVSATTTHDEVPIKDRNCQEVHRGD
jgi:hypothetical protein